MASYFDTNGHGSALCPHPWSRMGPCTTVDHQPTERRFHSTARIPRGSYMPLPIEDIDWEEVNYGDRDDYEGNVVSVYLHDYDYEVAKKSYNAKIVNTPRHDRLLPEEVYIHWDNTIEALVKERLDIITEDDAEGIIDNTQSLADDAASPALTLVEPDHGLLQISTTTSPPPSDDEDIDMFGEIKVGLMFRRSIGYTQTTDN